MNNFYHLIILDASGSMNCIRRQSLSGCNETIQTIREQQERNDDTCHFLSLVTLSTRDRTHVICDAQPIAEIPDLTEDQYRPNGGTPLYDCIGLSICRLQDATRKTDHNYVLVTIITDGQENASTLFDARKVKNLVEECKQDGWTFAFIGANQDEVLEAGKLGIHNTMAFEQSDSGSREMYHKMSVMMDTFCCAAPSMSDEDRESNLFSL